MGVSAIFVSTLALMKLPMPNVPPTNQQEYLAATLQAIVSFIVLGSILIRKHLVVFWHDCSLITYCRRFIYPCVLDLHPHGR